MLTSLPPCVHAVERFWFARAGSRRCAGVAEKIDGLARLEDAASSSSGVRPTIRSLSPVGFVRAPADRRTREAARACPPAGRCTAALIIFWSPASPCPAALVA